MDKQSPPTAAEVAPHSAPAQKTPAECLPTRDLSAVCTHPPLRPGPTCLRPHKTRQKKKKTRNADVYCTAQAPPLSRTRKGMHVLAILVRASPRPAPRQPNHTPECQKPQAKPRTPLERTQRATPCSAPNSLRRVPNKSKSDGKIELLLRSVFAAGKPLAWCWPLPASLPLSPSLRGCRAWTQHTILLRNSKIWLSRRPNEGSWFRQQTTQYNNNLPHPTGTSTELAPSTKELLIHPVLTPRSLYLPTPPQIFPDTFYKIVMQTESNHPSVIPF